MSDGDKDKLLIVVGLIGATAVVLIAWYLVHLFNAPTGGLSPGG